ncbi:ATP-binding protein [Clostridium sp.]|jgi:sensor histidine kinase regulating citrate/malate metabolism|uniref:ATP-binding protein n=1 Tax=Clostridium sp. TaxID=1506 RepID=UPI003EEA89BB
MRKEIKLQTKITLLIIIVVAISISVIIFFVASRMTRNIESKAKSNIMNVAQMMGHSKVVIIALDKKDPHKAIASYVNMQCKTLTQVEYITVADMEGIRYSHPNAEMIGEKFVGGDEYRVVENGDTYVSEATGTLGKSLRAFVPIFDSENKRQIGFVCVGTLTNSIENAKHTTILYIIIISLGGLAVGIIGAFLLANNIKKILLGLEPEEITRLYNEKMGIIDAIYEGLIAVDSKGLITLINDSAIDILNIKNITNKNKIIGQNIEEIFPTTRLITVLKTGVCEFDKEQKINNTIIMTNKIPIVDRGKVIGAIATFRNKTNVTKMAEELTGVKQIVDALRANNHEFMNKLHVILGLIYMGDLEEVKKYITSITEKRQKLLSMVTNKIKDPTIAALILGKVSRAKELGIYLIINEEVNLADTHKNIDSNDLVTILGNLIENGLESVNKCDNENKYVKVRIEEFNDKIKIEVEDSGVGIEAKNINKIFQRGYTTKTGSEGVGMALVKETIENSKGEISIISEQQKGCTVTVVLFKEE